MKLTDEDTNRICKSNIEITGYLLHDSAVLLQFQAQQMPLEVRKPSPDLSGYIATIRPYFRYAYSLQSNPGVRNLMRSPCQKCHRLLTADLI